jgi:type II secretory pathway component PulF
LTALFSIPFLLVGIVAGLATIYLALNSLSVRIQPGSVSVTRRLLFFPVYSRLLETSDISHLSTKRSGSTGQGVDKIQHFKLLAHNHSGKSVTIAEDLDGEDVAAHFRDYIAQRLNLESGDALSFNF